MLIEVMVLSSRQLFLTACYNPETLSRVTLASLGIGFQPNHVGCLVVYTINKITKQQNNKTKPYPHHVENIVEKYEENMWTVSGE